MAAWWQAQRFDAAPGSVLLLPGSDGLAGAVLGVGDREDAYAYAHAPFALRPGSRWQAQGLGDAEQALLQLGWGLGSYRFSRYRRARGGRAGRHAVGRVTDLVSGLPARTRLGQHPNRRHGPEQLEAAAREIAAEQRADRGDYRQALLQRNFTTIRAVGRACTARRG